MAGIGGVSGETGCSGNDDDDIEVAGTMGGIVDICRLEDG